MNTKLLGLFPRVLPAAIIIEAKSFCIIKEARGLIITDREITHKGTHFMTEQLHDDGFLQELQGTWPYSLFNPCCTVNYLQRQ